MNMGTATMNSAAGGPVGGGMMMLNNGGSPAVSADDQKNPDHIQTMLNTYVYEYFLKLRHYDIARALVNEEKFPIRTAPKQGPNHRKDGEVNGIDPDSMDTDVKDDLPDDLPRPVGAGSGTHGNGFLFEWFSVFSDLFAAHRGQHKGAGNPTPAMQYLIHHHHSQRMRENQQNQGLARPGVMMNPNFMRNGQMRNGMMNGDISKQRLTPQQMQQMAQMKQQQQMQQQMPRGDQPEGDPNARPATPADGESGGSPPKRPRLEGGQQFNAGMTPNGRPGVPGTGQQSMMIQSGFNPAMNQQFRQNGGMPPKGMPPNMANGMMNMANASSPMMSAMNNFEGMTAMDMYNRMPNQPAMQGAQNGQSGNHALQDYQMQLMLLEQQNKKRLMMARQEQHDSTNPRDGQPMAAGMGMAPPGMSPSGSRSGTSPNPAEQMKRTPQLGGSPAGDMQGRSPAPMFMNGIQPEFNPMFMKDGQPMMAPGGPNMRPPTSDMTPMQRQQQVQQQQGVRMFPGSQPMQQQPSQGQPQAGGTPGQREMPPPQAPPANNNAQRNNQDASPANSSNAPPTPSQSNKANPNKKKAGKQDTSERKRPTKKNSTANAPNAEENPPATPTPSTPITPVHPNNFSNGSGGKAPNQGAQPPNQPNQPNTGMPPNQHQMPNIDPQPNGGFPDFSTANENFNLDFSTLENSDVLENFDFDSFLNTSNDETFNFGENGMVNDFSMDPTEN